MPSLPWGDLVIIGAVAVIAYAMKDTILTLMGKSGGTSDLPVCTADMIAIGTPCRVASPFPLLPNVPVMPPGTVYVSQLCMMLGIGCPPGYGENAPAPEQPEGASCRNYDGTVLCDCYADAWPHWNRPSGNYVQQPDGYWCKQ
jgi:hypothetical protein